MAVAKLDTCVAIMRLGCTISFHDIIYYTYVTGSLKLALETDSIGSNNRLAYAVPPEYQGSTSPWVRISNLDIDVLSRRNFEPCVKFNRGLAIANVIDTVDVVSVRAHVNVALEKLAVGERGVR
jgi:hypothetical protein